MTKNILNKCPVCDCESIHIRSLSQQNIMSELEDYFAEKPPEKIEIIDYEIQQCKNCSLEYSFPLEAGSQSFYQWVTTRAGYYPTSRWEWFAVIEQIDKRERQNSISILDVGCGGGNFLEIAKKLSNTRIVGLDTTPESVQQCQTRGFEVYCETIESFSNKFSSEKFNYILSFHCLEHISQPKQFIESMLSVLKPMGSIFISTPYSPMSVESDWFDILNHPPHHLLRWNKKSYEELADQLGCEIKFYMPQANSVMARTANNFSLSKFGKNQTVSKFKLFQEIIKNPTLFLNIFFDQLKRDRVNKTIAADIVLVELKLF
ncbi:methyltransferase domain-containing protein [Nostoc sp. KVJ3]|uniref:class I SAM-dependent methyltransferase n=1 Tax=Nostoc sp. KVJ3 TaxID=457945 RepID=UPI00223719ED|nr:class I SAM-dependent methyltransferase [Nostoc sp. KVJ3]MCW5312450.1 methyltransferase domain-containing protein [Nostoc sp. KVJ3]